MIETSSGLPRKSSAIFGCLRKSLVILTFFPLVRVRLSCCATSLPVPGVVWLDVSGRCLPVYHDR